MLLKLLHQVRLLYIGLANIFVCSSLNSVACTLRIRRSVIHAIVRKRFFSSRKDLELGKSCADVCKEKLAVWVKRYQEQNKNHKATLKVNYVFADGTVR